MSERNRTINRLVQGTGLWAALTKPQKKTMRGMLERAYAAGQKAAETKEA